jgi:hypothetical protein
MHWAVIPSRQHIVREPVFAFALFKPALDIVLWSPTLLQRSIGMA